MSTHVPSEVLAAVERVLTEAAVTLSDAYPTPSIGDLSDGATEVQTPRRVHVVPVSDVYDVQRGGGRCQRVLTVDVVVHWPLAPQDVAQMVDDAVAFEDVVRTLPQKLAAVGVTAYEQHLLAGGDFAFNPDSATATWRVSLRYRRS